MELEIVTAAPILNTPDFRQVFGGSDGRQIPKNALGHPVHNEFVALPGMRFQIEETLNDSICRVRTSAYCAEALYLDLRFTCQAPARRPTPLFPSINELANRMERLLGTKYVWGGNWSAGIPEMLELYPPRGTIDDLTKTFWTFRGVDCSGLLYETSRGLTPRNTSDLLRFGESVRIENKTAKQMIKLLQPMDIVVWPGHVWYVLNSEFSIESKSPFGVIRRNLLERLEETLRERRGVNHWADYPDPGSHFVVRRIKTD